MSQEVVEARLGRPPQDMLEAAVVLEAWAGVPPSRALEAGRALMPAAPAAPRRSTGRLADPEPRRRIAFEAVAFGASVVAIALWASPLRQAIGAGGLGLALTVALPLTLALQWGLSSRYLSRPGGAAALTRNRAALAAGIAVVVAAPSAALGAAGLVAGLLTVVWVGGAILIRRGSALGYTALVAAATPAMLGASAPRFVLAWLAGTIALAALIAPRAPVGAHAPLGRWERALSSALIGAALGLLLVGDRSLGWTAGPAAAFLLVPSIMAGCWGSAHVWRLAHALPSSLAGVGIGERPRTTALRVLAGALARTVLACTALSLIAALALPLRESGTARACTLLGFGLLALVTLLAGLLESLARGRWALAAVSAGALVEALVASPVSGGALIAGAAVAVAVLLPAAVAPLRRPATTVATTVWIA
ncbi:hypothetical protein [Candidatus Solirubrobacter pratensis]|uniref:hypothetical protein n=1 Tax=Candidatus Solirubrobacter pratensis TaxID=1298857 RepID=UPI0004241589|nr:hypothetical protein [Candidatus Solirubrobacter pratensis]